MSSINILHLSSAKKWRGGENQLANLLLGFNTNGEKIESTVLCQSKTPLAQFCKKHEIQVETFEKKGVLSISYAKKIADNCSAKNIHLVHIHDSHSHTAYLIARLVFGCSVDAVLHRRVNFSNKGQLSKWKYNHPSIKKIIVVSKTIGETLSKNLSKRNQERITLIYDSLNLQKIGETQKASLRKELNLKKDTLLVGNISALSPEKDYATFLNVAERLLVQHEYDNLHFIIIGDGKLKKELEYKVKASSILEPYVHFLGFQANAVSYLKDFSIFLMTSKEEGLGTSVLESFACEVPVVSTNAGGLKEIVIEKETGLVCDVADVSQLTLSVEEIIQNNPLRKMLVENARSFVENKFNQQAMVNDTVTCYKTVLR